MSRVNKVNGENLQDPAPIKNPGYANARGRTDDCAVKCYSRVFKVSDFCQLYCHTVFPKFPLYFPQKKKLLSLESWLEAEAITKHSTRQ